MPSRKREVSSQTVHYRVLKSVDSKAIRVRLAVPPPAETCPLTMSPIADDELDFIPGGSFLQTLPLVKQITLPCGHVFGALNILYHFARRNMLCPCCRRGSASPIDAKYIPKHLRPAIVARVAHETRQEHAEQIGGDWALASQDLPSSAWITLVDRVQISVYPHIGLGDFPFAGFEFQLNSEHILPTPSVPVLQSPFAPPIVFELSSDDSRLISSHLRDLAVTQISLVVHARSLTDRVVELARTDAFDIDGAPGGRTVDGGVSHFAVRQTPPTEPFGLDALKWVAPMDLFHSLLQ